MKRNINLLTLVVLSMIIYSCNKDDFNYPEGYVGTSKVTTYPSVTTKGNKLTIINQGATYTDAGATVKVGEDDAEYVTKGSVNAATPGIYILSYDASNEDGFSASDSRTVVVMSTGSDISGNDFSGTYNRYVDGAANGQSSTWTKIGNGIYKVKNPGGAVLEDEITVVNYSGNNIAIPLQSTSVGDFSSKGGLYNPASNSFTWSIVNGGYGTAVREFRK